MVAGKEYGMQYVTDGKEKYIWYHHTGREQLFDLVADPYECRDLSRDGAHAQRLAVWRRRLAEINERRGDPRGQGGRLTPQPGGALTFSPHYHEWKRRAEAIDQRRAEGT